MADTLVDPVEPVPPTQRDPEPAPAAAPAPEAEAPKRSSKRVLVIAGVAMCVLGVAVAAVLWTLVFRYEPTALAHVPAGSNVVVRIESADIVLFGPVRNHLLPALLENRPKEPALNKVSVPDRIYERTGVRLPLDLREVLVATMDGKSVVGLFGGKIARGKFVEGLAEVAKEENWGLRLDKELLIGSNVVIAQADDGTIVVGTDRAIVMNALPATEEGTKLGLPNQGAIRFVVAKQAWENLATFGHLIPEASSFGGVRRGTGSFTLGSSPELVLRLDAVEGTELGTIEKGMGAVLANLRLLTMLAPDRMGEKEALRQAVVSRDGAQVVVRAPWSYEAMDRGAAALAARIRSKEGSDALPTAPSP